MPVNPPPGIQHLATRLAYEDPSAALEFLRDAFGFPERRDKRLEGAQGRIIVAEVQVGDAYLMIGGHGAHSMSSPAVAGAATASLMVYVDDIDQHFATAQANGAEIIAAPSDQYWGDRRYEAKDLEGHLWFFHERTRDVPQAEIDAFEAQFRQG